MPQSNDALYEIAATDAWRALLIKLEARRQALANGVLQAAAKQEINAVEVARASGRLEALTALIREFQEVGKNDGN